MDIGLVYDIELQGADIAVGDGLLQLEGGLRTAILISLFTDARADDADVLPTAGDDRRGWWADTFPEIGGDRIGSRIWLLSREKATNTTLERARGYARDALAWLIEDGIASTVEVATSWHALGVMRVDIDLTPNTAGATAERHTIFWELSYAV
jgi:phage gp46-like protein